MLENKDETFLLIKSLGKGEKKAFKQYADQTKGEKKYVILFDILDQMEVYNYKELKLKYKWKSLPVDKIALRDTIVKVAKNVFANYSLESKILSSIIEVDFYISKSLHSYALEKIDKLILIAEKNELDGIHLHLLKKKEKLVAQIRKNVEEINQLISEANQICSDLIDYNTILKEHNQKFYAINFDKKYSNKLFETSGDVKKISERVKKRGQKLVNRSLIAKYQHDSNYKDLLRIKKQMVDEIDIDIMDHSIWNFKKLQSYIINIHNYINSCFITGFLTDIPIYLNKLTPLIDSKILEIKKYAFSYYYLLQIAYLSNIREYEKAKEIMIEHGNVVLKEASPFERIQIYFFHLNIYFLLKEYKTCLKLINLILESPKVSNHYSEVAQNLQLLILLELKHFTVLDSKLRALERKNKDQKGRTKIEEYLALFLKKASKTLGASSSDFLDLQTKMEPLRSIHREAVIIEELCLRNWIGQKLER